MVVILLEFLGRPFLRQPSNYLHNPHTTFEIGLFIFAIQYINS